MAPGVEERAHKTAKHNKKFGPLIEMKHIG